MDTSKASASRSTMEENPPTGDAAPARGTSWMGTGPATIHAKAPCLVSDTAGALTGSTPADDGTTPSAGLELVLDNDGLPPSANDIEAILDGPPAASASTAAMSPSLRDPPLPPGLAAVLIDAEFDDDTAAKKRAGGLKTMELEQTDDSYGPALIPQVSGVPAAAMPPSLRDPPFPPGLAAALIDAEFDDDTAAKKRAGGLKTTGLQTQDHDGQPAFVPDDGEDAPAALVPTKVEDGGATIDPPEDQPGQMRRQLHNEVVSDDNYRGDPAPSPQVDHGNPQPNTGGPRQLPIRPPPPSMLPRPDDEESSDPSPTPPLLPSDPSVLMLKATLVEEMPVYHGVQVPDEEQVSGWRRQRKNIIGASIGLLVGLAVAVGILLSSNSTANNDEMFVRLSIQPSLSSQPTQSAMPSQSLRPSDHPTLDPSAAPSQSLRPSDHPTLDPSAIPSSPPSGIPSLRPSSVTSTVPSSFPSSIPSSSFQLSTTYKCFVDLGELKSAVDQYDKQSCKSNEGCEVGKTYGWPMNSWCLSQVTDMNELFSRSVSNEDISSWDVSSVTNMYGMFQLSSFNGDISSWDVSSVLNMGYMLDHVPFNGDISGWNVSGVTNMDGMFAYASSFNGDISGWNVSSVTSTRLMFYENSSFNSDVSSWNVSSVTNMGYMFYRASSFNVDIRSWDVSSVNNREYIFDGSSFDDDNSPWSGNP